MPIIDAVKDWSLFSVDAVGLVTLLGVNTLDKSLGRLVKHPWAECFPLLAGHIIPDDLINEPIPGFKVYNITDKIVANGVNAWFSRWVMGQELSNCSTIFDIEVLDRRKKTDSWNVIGIALGSLLHAFLIVFSVLIGDPYALAASLSLTISTMTRVITLMLSRARLDELVDEGMKMTSKPIRGLVSTPNNKSCIINAPCGVLIKALLQDVRPANENIHRTLRGVGWVAFGVNIITMGMSCLAMQIILPVLMIVSTVIIARGIGCSERRIGSSLSITTHTIPGKETYKRTFATLRMNEEEEEAMVSWNWFPLRTNESWWNDYRAFSKEYHENPVLPEKVPTRHFIIP